MAKPFYVTTPIYYINDVPHLGTAYTTIAADVVARYHRLLGNDSFFVTGTDEHGLKIERAAQANGLDSKSFADKMSRPFREAWGVLGCEYSHFVRTTDASHEQCVIDSWRRIKDRGDLYLGSYGGWYCVGCEAYYTEKDLEPGAICPLHKQPTEHITEPTYFFRLSNYTERLLVLYEQRPDFVLPIARMNEVKSFVRAGLEDLSVSRTTFQWGIPVPDDAAHVMYVWFDALFSYFSPVATGARRRFWPANLHLVGKDILRFHAVYWPAFLMSLGMSDDELPRHVFAHGFLTFNGHKMSKTLRNTVSPLALADAFGVDTLRYYLMRAIAFGQDGDFNAKELVIRYNSDLGNDLGNLLNRILPQCVRLGGAVVPTKGELMELDRVLLEEVGKTLTSCKEAYDAVQPQRALSTLWALISGCNTYLERAAPWTAIKQGDALRAGTILSTALQALEAISTMLWPVMPTSADALRVQLGLAALTPEVGVNAWDTRVLLPAGAALGTPTPLFPRIDAEREAELMANLGIANLTATAPEPGPKRAATQSPPRESATATEPSPFAQPLDFEEFAKIDLRVGLVKEATRVPQKERLLKLLVDLGEGRDRQILAGIAGSVQPEEMVGLRVVIVANLKPRAFGKLVSEGMLLAADVGEKIKPIHVDPDTEPGTRVK